MKKYILIAAAFLIGNSSFAQIQRTVETPMTDSTTEAVLPDQTKMGNKEILKELNLTKEQKQQLRAHRTAAKEAKQAIENDNNLTPANKKLKLRELKKENLTKIKAILTPEQLEKYMKLRREGKVE